jgi:hypothetical protein
MGSYNLGEEEIADIFEEVEFENECEGDFYEETFIEGAKIYLDRLRGEGAFIYSEKADNKGIMCKGCGKAKKNGKCIICKKIKKEVIGGLK